MPRAVCHDPTTIFGGFSLPAEEKKKRKKKGGSYQSSLDRSSLQTGNGSTSSVPRAGKKNRNAVIPHGVRHGNTMRVAEHARYPYRLEIFSGRETLRVSSTFLPCVIFSLISS